MRRAIFARCIFTVAVALLTAGALGLVFWQHETEVTEKNRLTEIVSVISDQMEHADMAVLKKQGGNLHGGVRLVLISSDGNVLFGSIDNGFPDINSVIRGAAYNGAADVKSDGSLHIYASRRLMDGNYLVAVEVISDYKRFIWIVPMILAGLLAAYALASVLSAHLTSRVVEQAEKTVSSLETMLDGPYRNAETQTVFEEFLSAVFLMNDLAGEIEGKLQDVTNQRNRIDSILSSMNEGLVVLSDGLNVLMINKSAAGFFGVSREIKGQNLLRLTHMPKIIETARKTIQSGLPSVLDVTDSGTGKTLQIIVSPVTDEQAKYASGGAIMLITDVTAIRKAEQIRSEFVANASHELKTPLTAIKGFTELIETGVITDKAQVQRYLGLVRAETERMIELINDILRLSEMESVASDTGKAMVSLKLIAQKAAESVQMQAAEKEVTLKVSGETGTISANPDRMMQLVLNLMENAVKYNVSGGSVSVDVKETEDEVELIVADTGIGIPKESQDRVFERFYRVDKSRSQRQKGTGLGLSIVKHIVSLYKGRIKLESEPGQGTTIQIFLPK